MSTSGITADRAQFEFLQLLVTQLRHQDPLEPMKQENFLGQLAQFSTLEGVEKLNANFADMLKLEELTQGANLVGHIVVYHQGNDGATTDKGLVEAVSVENNNLVLSVNGESVPIDNVQSVQLF